MSAPPLDPDGELLAAELALSLLTGEARVSAEARLATDPPFAAAHDRWTAHWAESFAPAVSPPPALWELVATAAGAGAATRAALVPLARVRRWQAAAVAALAAAVVLAVVAVTRTPAPLPPRLVEVAPPLVAVLSGPTDKGLVVVRLDPARARLLVMPTGLSVGRHAAQLWVIGGDGTPRSIGLVAAHGHHELRPPAPAAAVLAAGATLAISVEPIGGSPSGLPTGPVILSGKVAAT